jgi:hypothetical protein
MSARARPLPGETKDIPNFHDIHVTNLTVTRSPVAGRILGLPEQMARDITFTNVKIDSVRGFLVQDGTDVVFDHVQITPKTGDAIVLDNGSVTWNGEAKSGTSWRLADSVLQRKLRFRRRRNLRSA